MNNNSQIEAKSKFFLLEVKDEKKKFIKTGETKVIFRLLNV